MSTAAAAMSTTETNPTNSAAHSEALVGLGGTGPMDFMRPLFLTSEHLIIEINGAVSAAPGHISGVRAKI